MSDWTQNPPQSPPPPHQGPVHWPIVLLAIGIVASGLCTITWIKDNASSAPQSVATPVEQPPADVELTQIVFYKNRLGFQVCGRQQLHHCVVTFGANDSGGRSTIRFSPVDIDPLDSCNEIGPRADNACSDAGAGLMAAGGPSLAWVQCVARHGFLYRGSQTVTVLDPRDEADQLPSGVFRIVCAEGHRDARFDDTL